MDAPKEERWPTLPAELAIDSNLWDCSQKYSSAELRAAVVRLQARLHGYEVVNWTAIDITMLMRVLHHSQNDVEEIISKFRLKQDPDKKQVRVDILEVFTAIALTCEGTRADRLRFVFDLFDVAQSGRLGSSALRALFSALFRAATNVHLALPFDELHLDRWVAAALTFSGQDTTKKDDSSDSHDDLKLSVVSCDDSESEDDFARRGSELTAAEFVHFCARHDIARPFFHAIGTPARIRKCVFAWRLQTLVKARRIARNELRPMWALPDKNAILPKDVFVVPPVFVPHLGPNSECTIGLLLRTKVPTSLLVRVERVFENPYDREGQQATIDLWLNAILDAANDNEKAFFPSFDNDLLITTARDAAIVLQHDCPADRSVILPLRPFIDNQQGTRFLVSLALDYDTPKLAWYSYYTRCLEARDNIRVLDSPSRRQSQNLTVLAVSTSNYSSVCDRADVLLHMRAKCSASNIEQYAVSLLKATVLLLQAGKNIVQAYEHYCATMNQVEKKIKDDSNHKFIVDAKSRTHDGFDHSPLHIFSEMESPSRRELNRFLESDTSSTTLDDDTLRKCRQHVVNKMRAFEQEATKHILATGLVHVGPLSICDLSQLWKDATSWTDIESRITIMLSVASNTNSGRLVVLCPTPLASDPAMNTTAKDSLTLQQYCEINADSPPQRKGSFVLDDKSPIVDQLLWENSYDARDVRPDEQECCRFIETFLAWKNAKSGHDILLISRNRRSRIEYIQVTSNVHSGALYQLLIPNPLAQTRQDMELDFMTPAEHGSLCGDVVHWNLVTVALATEGDTPTLIYSDSDIAEKHNITLLRSKEASGASGIGVLLAPDAPTDQMTPQPQLLVGPIVGEVSSTSAVLVFESDRSANVLIKITPVLPLIDFSGPLITYGKLRAYRPTPIIVKGLAPGQRFKYVVAGFENGPLYGLFNTRPSIQSAISIHARSCLSLSAGRLDFSPHVAQRSIKVLTKEKIKVQERICDLYDKRKLFKEMIEQTEVKSKVLRKFIRKEYESNAAENVAFAGVVSEWCDDSGRLDIPDEGQQIRLVEIESELQMRLTRLDMIDRELIDISEVLDASKVNEELSSPGSKQLLLLARDLSSARPDCDVVVHVGSLLSDDVLINIQKMLSLPRKNVEFTEEDAEEEVCDYIRDEIRNVLSSTPARAALANGSHLSLGNLPVANEDILALYANVFEDYTLALQGKVKPPKTSRLVKVKFGDNGSSLTNLYQYGEVGILFLRNVANDYSKIIDEETRGNARLLRILIVIVDVSLASSGCEAAKEILHALESWKSKALSGSCFHVISPTYTQSPSSDSKLFTWIPCRTEDYSDTFTVVRAATFSEKSFIDRTAHTHAYVRISIGPVLGEITDKTARVLVEVTSPAILILCLRGADRARTQERRLCIRAKKAHIPNVFVIENLKAECLYEYAVIALDDDDDQTIDVDSLSLPWGVVHNSRKEGTLRTLPTWPLKFRVLVAPSILYEDIWPSLEMKRSPATCITALRAMADGMNQFRSSWAQVSSRSRFPKSPVHLLCHMPSTASCGIHQQARQELNLIRTESREEARHQLRDDLRLAYEFPYLNDSLRKVAQLWTGASPNIIYSEETLRAGEIIREYQNSLHIKEMGCPSKENSAYADEYSVRRDGSKQLSLLASSSFRRYGGVGILVLESLSSSRQLRDEQWSLLDHAVRTEGVVALLILCCDWAAVSKTDLTLDALDSVRMLTALCSWLAFPIGASQQRSAVLLSSGSPYRSHTTITDTETGSQLTQVCLGDASVCSDRSDRHGAFSSRFSYKTTLPKNSTAFEMITISTDQRKGLIKIEDFPRESCSNKISLISGPVLGPFRIHVMNNDARASAFLLIELDADAEVTCICHDVLSHETYVGKATMSRFRPCLVKVADLRLGRRYSLRICAENISLIPADRDIYFHTPDSYGADLNICVVSGFRPQDVKPGDLDVLSSLSDRLDTPWHGVDMLLHIGFRVSIIAAIQDAACLILGTQTEDLDDDSLNLVEENILERFREEYRCLYTLPAMGNFLSSTANLITGSTRALLAALEIPPSNLDNEAWLQSAMRAIHLARSISFEYERQLWDHAGFSDRGKGHAAEGGFVTLHNDTVGIFIADLSDGADSQEATLIQDDIYGIRLMSDFQKDSFLAALDTSNIAVLILVLECPLLKPRQRRPADSSKDLQWEFLHSDILWCIERLHVWRAGRSGRDVKIVCGSAEGSLCWAAGMRSLLSLQTENESYRVSDAIEQIVVGPICGRPTSKHCGTDDYDCSGKLEQCIHFNHIAEKANCHYRVLELTTERLCEMDRSQKEMIGSCEVSNALTSEIVHDTQRAQNNNLLLDVSIDVKSDPGFVPDDIWYLVRANPAVDAMNAYIGGRGYGDGDEVFGKLVKKSIFSKDGLSIPQIETRTRMILSSLYNALPSPHCDVLACLNDPFVASIIVHRANAEAIEIWQDYVSRCFSLAAALRQAVLSRAEKSTQGAFPPVVTVDEEVVMSSCHDARATDNEFHARMNALAETDPKEYEKYATEMELRAAERMAAKDETVWECRRRCSLLRKEARRRNREATVTSQLFNNCQ